MVTFDSLIETPFGPTPPPSKWPLQAVPFGITEFVVDALSHQARESLIRVHGLPDNFTMPWTPLSIDLKNMSLVDQSFRRAVLERVLETVALCNGEYSIARAISVLEKGSYVHVRRLLLYLRDEEEDRQSLALALGQLFTRCVKVNTVIDISMDLTYLSIPLPVLTTCFKTVLKAGADTPFTLDAPALKMLMVSAAKEVRSESGPSTESFYFKLKVECLCRSLRHLDGLELRLPAISIITSASRTQPVDVVGSFEDPLPPNLQTIGVLTIAIPCCTVAPGSARKSHWEGYLGWLTNTAPVITHLKVRFNWTAANLVGTSVTKREVLESMNLCERDWQQEPWGLSNTFENKPVEGDGDIKSFLADLIRARPGLQQITLDFWVAASENEEAKLFWTVEIIAERAQVAGSKAIQIESCMNIAFMESFLETDFNSYVAERDPPLHDAQ